MKKRLETANVIPCKKTGRASRASGVLGILSLFVILSVSQGCNDDLVSIPPADKDKAPIITVNALASGGSGQIQYPEASHATCPGPCNSYVTLNTDLVLVIAANNPGGVQHLGVVVSQDGQTTSVENESAPDSNNKVPPKLGILGSYGAGKIGSNPLLYHMNKPTTKVGVVVSATNYNNMTSLYAITYYVKGQ
jgi:hypothetical protein